MLAQRAGKVHGPGNSKAGQRLARTAFQAPSTPEPLQTQLGSQPDADSTSAGDAHVEACSLEDAGLKPRLAYCGRGGSQG